MAQSPTYWDYLQLDKLLSLQGGLENDEEQLMPDELHFIVVHQVYELWFKLILRELREARNHLAEPKVDEEIIPYVVHHLRRVIEILELAVQQWSVMETLTPQDFLAFRDKLLPASGFQSFQMREIETLLGLDQADRPRYGNVEPMQHILEQAASSPGGQLARERLLAVREEQSLRSALHDWLYRTPIQGSSPGDADDAAVVASFLDAYLTAYGEQQREQQQRLLASGIGDPVALAHRFAESAKQTRRFLSCEDVDAGERDRMRRIRAALLFIESYRELPLVAWPRLLLDAVVGVEEQFVLWRNRHARMTERTIGRRIGTGGSSGVAYLDKAAESRIFPELWEVRTILLPRRAVPPLQNPGFYGFADRG